MLVVLLRSQEHCALRQWPSECNGVISETPAYLVGQLFVQAARGVEDRRGNRIAAMPARITAAGNAAAKPLRFVDLQSKFSSDGLLEMLRTDVDGPYECNVCTCAHDDVGMQVADFNDGMDGVRGRDPRGGAIESELPQLQRARTQSTIVKDVDELLAVLLPDRGDNHFLEALLSLPHLPGADETHQAGKIEFESPAASCRAAASI